MSTVSNAVNATQANDVSNATSGTVVSDPNAVNAVNAVNTVNQTQSIHLVDAGTIFPDIDFLKARKIPRIAVRSNLVPTCNPSYIPNERNLQVALAWMFSPNRNLSLSLFGETGTGKTEFVTYLCDKLNWPLYKVSVSESLRPENVKGGLAIKDGNTLYEDSVVTQAVRNGGVLLLDEMDKGSFDLLAALHPVLEYKPFPIEKTGEVVMPHPFFRVIATCQTPGIGDVSGRYGSVGPLDEAVKRRFMWIKAEYPAPSVELDILEKITPEIPSSTRIKMVRFAGKAREALYSGEDQNIQNPGEHSVNSAFSTRVLVEWARMIKVLKDFSLSETFNLVFGAACEINDREVFSHLAKIEFGDEFEKSPF